MRRVHVPTLQAGTIALPTDQARHIRNVLRLRTGDALEVFDDAGATALGKLIDVSEKSVTVKIDAIQRPGTGGHALDMATAVPKGARADWLVEKLSELGVRRMIPLASERSVVLPAGLGKTDRWRRIAVESAKQSRREGVMAIEALTPVAELARQLGDAPAASAWLLSTEPGARPAREFLRSEPLPGLLIIGPEGGWTADELKLLDLPAVRRVRLVQSVLRVETAAIAAAALVLSWAAGAAPEAEQA